MVKGGRIEWGAVGGVGSGGVGTIGKSAHCLREKKISAGEKFVSEVGILRQAKSQRWKSRNDTDLLRRYLADLTADSANPLERGL